MLREGPIINRSENDGAGYGETNYGESGYRESGKAALILLMPALVLEFVFLFLPLAYIAFRSFYDWQPSGVSEFIGFENYAFVFTDPEFWEIVRNQVFYLTGLPLWVISPLLAAYVLRENVWNAALFRSIYFLPAVMSPAIVGLLFRSLLATDGTFNAVLNHVGLDGLSQPWLTDAAFVKPVVIIMVLWAGFGTGVLIFTAAFAAVPKDIFEAARLDGARFWQEFFYIAVPSIKNTIVLWTLFQIVAIFLFMFGWIYVLTGGGPGLSSATMDFSIYQQFIRFGFYGTAAAQTVVLVISIIAVPVIGYLSMGVFRLIRRTLKPPSKSLAEQTKAPSIDQHSAGAIE